MFKTNKSLSSELVRLRVLQLIAVFAFMLLVSLVVPVAAQAEGKDSGGGGVVLQVESNFVLVDVLNILGLQEALAVSSGVGDRQAAIGPAFKIGDTPSANESFRTAGELMYGWEFAILAQAGFKTTYWEFADFINRRTQFYSPVNIPNSTPMLAAYYSTNLTPKNGRVSLSKDTYYKVIINRELWNQLSTFSQVGLIVHETLRQVQFGFLGRYNDEILQKVTAMMLLCKPTPEANRFLFLALSNMIAIAESQIGSYSEFTKNCRTN